MPTYPLPTLAPTISPLGITAPAYSDIYQSLQASFQAIYGSDAYIPADSQDGQLLAIFARAIADSNNSAISAFNSFSPATAQGQALSSNVKINGIARAVASNGSVTQRIIGVVGTTILNGIVTDAQNNRWLLPASVTIPPAGQIDVTATAESIGAILGPAGSITTIATPSLGWQSTTNPTAASPGAPVETDAALRRRQTFSTALPSSTNLDGIVGAVSACVGVTQVKGYDNDSDSVDANGQPAHSICIVATGGSVTDITNAIALKKTPGAYTYGTTSAVVVSAQGLPQTIRYFVSIPVPVSMAITIKALTGYTSATGTAIIQALADYVNGLGIGKRIDLGKLYLPAQFFGGGQSATFEVNAITQAIKSAANTAADIDIPFNSRATLALADIVLTVT